VLKQHFQILLLASEYSAEIQSCIPSALVAIHNFIQIHNPHKKDPDYINPDYAPGGFYAGDHSIIPGASNAEHEEDSEASRCRDQIADDMWRQYTLVLAQRAQAGLLEDETSGSDESNDEDNIEEEET